MNQFNYKKKFTVFFSFDSNIGSFSAPCLYFHSKSFQAFVFAFQLCFLFSSTFKNLTESAMKCLLSSHAHTRYDAISANSVFFFKKNTWVYGWTAHIVLYGWMDRSSDFNENRPRKKQTETKTKIAFNSKQWFFAIALMSPLQPRRTCQWYKILPSLTNAKQFPKTNTFQSCGLLGVFCVLLLLQNATVRVAVVKDFHRESLRFFRSFHFQELNNKKKKIQFQSHNQMPQFQEQLVCLLTHFHSFSWNFVMIFGYSLFNANTTNRQQVFGCVRYFCLILANLQMFCMNGFLFAACFQFNLF